MPDFKYTLTRFCLRSGQLTLPHNLLELFPGEGAFEVEDSESGERLQLELVPPRTVAGMRGYFERHKPAVNDVIQIRQRDGGELSFALLTRGRRTPARKGELEAQQLLDALFEQATPLSEAEVRALHPEVARELDLGKLFAADERFMLKEGRWQPVPREQPEELAEQVERDAEVPPPAEPAAEAPREEQREDRPEDKPAMPPRRQSRNNNRQDKRARRASVTPYPRGVIFPGDAGLNSALEAGDLSQQQRIKNLLIALGFRVEGLAHGQLLAQAELGRRQFSVLVHLLDDHGKLDWAGLLTRRREIGATYVAVFGHDLDLAPLEAPSELARASLWSLKGAQRLEQLLTVVPLSPMDLEGHFERDGLFEKGLERFERSVQKRVEERGVFSAVLTRVASLRAPTIFMLDDIADAELSREQVLRVLELLAQAPFHFVSRVDSGEFCLRFKVADGLSKLSEYALSLQSRLPSRRTERLRGSGEGSAFAVQPQEGAGVLEPRQISSEFGTPAREDE